MKWISGLKGIVDVALILAYEVINILLAEIQIHRMGKINSNNQQSNDMARSPEIILRGDNANSAVQLASPLTPPKIIIEII